MRYGAPGALGRATLLSLSQRFPEPESGEGLVEERVGARRHIEAPRPEVSEGLVEEPVDLRRYVEALRRRAGLIVGLAVGIAILVFLISLALPKSYTATAKIAPSVQATTSAASGSTTTQLNLATIEAYVTSPAVLATAAHQLGGESAASLEPKITTSLDTAANIVAITATDGSAPRSAQLANRVAQTFLSVRTGAERAQLAQQATLLTGRMQAARAAGSTGLATALQQQISGILAQEASAGSDLELLALAPVPGSPSSPRPTRNALFAFIAVLFIAVLAVGGRELLAPSISGGRELSGLMGMPILGRVPRVANDQRARRRASDTAEAEAYRFLSKSLELSVWPNRSRLIAVTSAVRGEGKTTVVSRLGAAFAETGSKTLLVSADLRWPGLDKVFGLPPDHDGLSGELSSLNGNRGTAESSQIERVDENLYVLPSGPPPTDPAAMLTNDVVTSLFERIRRLNFEYVLFDLPPLIAVAETQLFVRQADAAILVSMVGRATVEQLSQTRDLLNRLPVWPAGIVVLDVRAAGRQLTLRNAGQIVARPDGSARAPGAQVSPPPEPASSTRARAPSSPRQPSDPASSDRAPAPSQPQPSQSASSPQPARASRRRPPQKTKSPEPPPPASTQASLPASTQASPPAPSPEATAAVSRPEAPTRAPDPQATPPASPGEATVPVSAPEVPTPAQIPQASQSTPPAEAPTPASPRQPRQKVQRAKSSPPASRRAPRQNAPRREPPPPK